MIKEMLAGLPTRPIAIIAPIVMLLVLTLYYNGQYQTCSERSGLRQHFTSLIQDASEQGNTIFSVASATQFSWDSLQIVNAYQLQSEQIPDCPFDWDWSKQHRENLAAEERLSMLVFVKEGRMVDYIELDKNSVDLGKLKPHYLQADARFTIHTDPVTSQLVMSDLSDS